MFPEPKIDDADMERSLVDRHPNPMRRIQAHRLEAHRRMVQCL